MRVPQWESPRLRRVWLARVCAVVMGCAIAVSSAWAQARRIELADYAKIVGVSDPQISPDGKSIVCVVSRVNLEQDRNDRALVLVDIASGAQRVLTYDRKETGFPRWSPDGSRLAFLSAVGPAKEEKAQIFVLSMSGDAMKLTDAPLGVEQFAWRPNGAEIAYVTADEPENKKDIEKHLDAFEVGDNGYLETKAPTPSHIWLIGAAGGKARKLTSGAWSLPKTLPPSSPASPLSWSADGRLLAFAKQDDPHSGDSDRRTVQVLDVESGGIRKLTGHEKMEGFGLFSPDGSQLAYWYPRDGERANENEIFVAPAAGGDGVDVTRGIDRNILRAIWMPDGKSLLVGGHDGTQVSLWLQAVGGGTAKKLALGEVSPSWSFWVDVSVGRNGAIAIAGSTPGQLSELYYMASANDAPKRLTNFNQEIASLSLGRRERFEWQGPGKFSEDGVVVYPPDFQKGKKYPLVLVIHGGPRAASTTQFSFLSYLIAAQDCVVFEPNYRGSENLGNAYTRAIWNNAGDGPGRDVMAGIEALKKLGFVDEAKIAVSGWSYGGYMTTWLLGHYSIWKVAVAGAAVTNMFDQYNLADFNVTERYIFSGSPYVGENMKEYREQSPITYAAHIKAPTLVLSDTGDFRVTITQSYQLYHALKDNGMTTRFFAYPVGGHFPNDPVREMDVYRRWSDWLMQYLKQ